jgi:hypothetical protein
MTSEEPHRYTVEAANALLPELRASLERIRAARQVVLAGGQRVRKSAALNGGGTPGREYWEALAALRREVEDLSERDIILRDPETGLLDFPALRDGEEIYLCWLPPEEQVGFWHRTTTGYAGRRPL